MAEFELLRDVTIGQYIPTGSVVHRLDPRAKIMSALFLILAISFARTALACLVMLLIVLGIALVARLPLSYVMRGLKLGLPILVFIFVMQLLFQGWAEPAGQVYFQWWFIRVTRASLDVIAIGLLRVIAFIFLTSMITMTSTINELTHGTELLLKPFRRFGVPSHELALMVMIALRFVPTLAEELERIMKAQASRCGDVGATRTWRPDRAARALLPLVVPLFMNAFRRAEELVWAMEARGYVSGGRRSKYVVFKSTWRDWVAPLVCLALFLFVWRFPWPPVRTLLAPFGITL